MILRPLIFSYVLQTNSMSSWFLLSFQLKSIRIFYVPVCFFLRSDPDVKQETTGSGKQKYCYLIHSLQDVSGILLNTGWGLSPDCLWFSLQVMKEWIIMPLSENKFEIDHHTGDYPPYFIRLSGCRFFDFFNIPQNVLHVPSLWDGAYGLSTLSEMTKKSNLLQMLLQT